MAPRGQQFGVTPWAEAIKSKVSEAALVPLQVPEALTLVGPSSPHLPVSHSSTASEGGWTEA